MQQVRGGETAATRDGAVTPAVAKGE
jgi:hypothetical protein